MIVPLVRHGLLAVLLTLFAGCSFFGGKPPLPKHASIERDLAPSVTTDFAALVVGAEIVYFPSARAASGARSEPSALLLEAMRQTGAAFAIGWDLMDAGQQSLLDELRGKTGAAREEIIGRLELAGNGRAREHCRAVLRDPRFTNVIHLALRCPNSLVARLEAPGRLTPEEEKQFPEGYAAPPGGFEAYAERAASNRGNSDRAFGGSYRAYLGTQQFVAERIVGHFRSAGVKGKLLVFLRASDLEAGLGVPRYVAQKLQVRQLVLDSSGTAPERTKLLTFQDTIGGPF